MKSTCKDSSVNVETADMSTDSEKALKSAIGQQPLSIIEAVTPTEKRSCSLKTIVAERHGAQTKASDGRINLPVTGTCVKLDDANSANCLAKALSRGGAPRTLHTTRTASSFGHTGRDDVW